MLMDVVLTGKQAIFQLSLGGIPWAAWNSVPRLALNARLSGFSFYDTAGPQGPRAPRCERPGTRCRHPRRSLRVVRIVDHGASLHIRILRAAGMEDACACDESQGEPRRARGHFACWLIDPTALSFGAFASRERANNTSERETERVGCSSIRNGACASSQDSTSWCLPARAGAGYIIACLLQSGPPSA